MKKIFAAFWLFALLLACQATPTRVPSSPTVAIISTAPPLSAPTLAPTRVPSSPAPTLADDLQIYAASLTDAFKNDLALLDRPTRYNLALTFDASTSTLTGSEDVRYTNRQTVPLNEIYFRLFANYPNSGGKINITAITMDGANTATALEAQNTALRVQLARPLAPNAALNAHLDFVVTVPRNNSLHYADFTYADGTVTLPSVYPIIPAYDAQGWHIELPPEYGDLVYADVALYQVSLTAPSAMNVMASGSTIDTKDNGNGTKTWKIVAAPARDFDFNLSERLQKTSAQVGETTINSYSEPSDADSGKSALQFSVDAFKIFTTRFGAYPYRELDVIETPTTAGGIEYPGIVVVARNLYRNANRRDFFEFATAHEISHQWWYALVGDDQVNQPWVDESLAQYSTLIYYEDLRGVSAGETVLKGFQSNYDRAKNANRDKAVNLPVNAYDESTYSAIVYQKGPLFYDAIRKKMSDATFFKFLQTYFQKFRYKVATGDDVVATAESACSCSLRAEYQQWILNPK